MMDFSRIAYRVANVHKRVSLESILETVQKNCPSKLREDIGKLIGTGYYGEAYEVDGGDKVLKVAIGKSDSEAKSFLDKLRDIQSLDSGVFCEVYDFGLLCDVSLPDSKYMVKEGTAYFYIMEKLVPIPPNEVKIASRTVNDLEDLARKPNYEQERKKYMFSKAREYKRDGDIEDGGVDHLKKGADLFDRMRKAGVGHRDMHTKNILQNADGEYKLIDLESAKILTAK
jgi:serine/threonine protein kinase